MHIPDGFLTAGVTGVTWAGAGIGVAAALRAEKADPNPMPAGILGATAAFVFAAQMINIPVAPGISGHLVGAALSAVLLGPWRAVIVMAVVLAVQALLFQDGGITALGANTLDMGVAASLTGFAVASMSSRLKASLRARVVGGVLGAFAATLVSAVLTGLWLGLSGLYPVLPVVQLMLVSHVAIGLLEAALTGAVLATVARWRPDLLRGLLREPTAGAGLAVAGGLVGLAIAVAAFLSPFASALPDGLEYAAERLGFAHRAAASWPAPFPDYALPFLSS
ncbi:MAG: energy-coupling factor ABC transporter permease, partial [Rhodospirillaceae bacterium]